MTVGYITCPLAFSKATYLNTIECIPTGAIWGSIQYIAQGCLLQRLEIELLKLQLVDVHFPLSHNQPTPS